MGKGDLLVYNNCYNESDKRNENMIKNYGTKMEFLRNHFRLINPKSGRELNR